jgi:hypothetical protein
LAFDTGSNSVENLLFNIRDKARTVIMDDCIVDYLIIHSTLNIKISQGTVPFCRILLSVPNFNIDFFLFSFSTFSPTTYFWNSLELTNLFCSKHTYFTTMTS